MIALSVNREFQCRRRSVDNLTGIGVVSVADIAPYREGCHVRPRLW